MLKGMVSAGLEYGKRQDEKIKSITSRHNETERNKEILRLNREGWSLFRLATKYKRSVRAITKAIASAKKKEADEANLQMLMSFLLEYAEKGEDDEGVIKKGEELAKLLGNPFELFTSQPEQEGQAN